MAIATRDDLISGFSRRQVLVVQKPSVTAEGAGLYQSLWKSAGNPAAGATAATGNGAIPTKATSGAIPFTNPGGGRTLRLAGIELQGITAGKLILFDVLWWNSGFDCTLATLQSIGSPPTLPSGRCDTTGLGVELWGYFWAAPGATGTTFTAIYTNEAGTGSRSATYVHPANAETIDQIVPFNLAAGDRGVRTVASVQLGVSTGAAGNFGLMLLRRIASIPIIAGLPSYRDWSQLGLPEIFTDACLMAVVLASTTSTGQIDADLVLAEN